MTDLNLTASAPTGTEAQAFGTLRPVALALGENARATSVAVLNQTLADTLSLRDLYKKHHWQVSGPTFHQLHLLYDKHAREQAELVDALAERIMALGGVSVAISHDIAETTRLPRAPKGRESPADQLRRLLAAHELVLAEAHEYAKAAADNGDDGTNDLLVSEVIRTNEAQSWMLAEHLDGLGDRS
jgi:starvation-inducible DNA-binding protein